MLYKEDMTQFVHPTLKQITLPGVLGALADPTRLLIVKTLLEQDGCLSCCKSVKCSMPKSTISHHFRILREAGLVRTTKKGVENLNTVRVDDINGKFPGLLDSVLNHVDLPW
jgi:DNA-binding transcriptional ArsR family regulator